MICPHCSTAVRYEWSNIPAIENTESTLGSDIKYAPCPNCQKFVVYLREGSMHFGASEFYLDEIFTEKMIYPKESNFENSTDIPAKYLQDYKESLKVLSASPKASAALSRRLLQSILRDEFKIKKGSLSHEIQSFIEKEGVPSHLTDAVDAVRNIGNFAAHPIKDKNTAEIVEVEIGEAEWLIEVIGALFDFTFIQPLKLERRRKELNLKLEKVGKPPMKSKI